MARNLSNVTKFRVDCHSKSRNLYENISLLNRCCIVSNLSVFPGVNECPNQTTILMSLFFNKMQALERKESFDEILKILQPDSN